MVAYFSYVAFSATQQTGQKTSNIVQVIEFAILHYCSALAGQGYLNSNVGVNQVLFRTNLKMELRQKTESQKQRVLWKEVHFH